METKSSKKFKAIDFFCGAGGMTYGMNQAGIKVIAGIDIDKSCKETYEYNNPDSKFIEADIKELSFEELSEKAGIKKNDDNLIFIGCSPCQYWSIIRTNKSNSSNTKNLLFDFQKFLEYFKPGYIVIENVPGILKRKEESGLQNFMTFLEKNNYGFDFKIINANDYGVPQSRKRFLLVASRVKKDITLPKPDVNNKPIVKDFIGIKNGFKKVNAGFRDNSDLMHTVAKLSKQNLRRLKLTPVNGGKRNSWKGYESLQINAYTGKDKYFSDVYGRMSWDKPSPTITTKFISLSNGRFGHPEELRAISLREGATLQTFPKTYIFKEKSIASKARLIGNSVPPLLSQQIGKILIN